MDMRLISIMLALAIVLIQSEIGASFRATTDSTTEDGPVEEGPASDEEKEKNELAVKRAACIKEVAEELHLLDKAYVLPKADVMKRVEEARRYYGVVGEVPLGPEQLESCLELQNQFKKLLEGQGECFNGINPLSPKWIVPAILQEADKETKLRFEALYACEWGRFTGPALDPSVYGALVGSQDEITDRKDESHEAKTPSNDARSKTGDRFEKVLPLIKSEISIDDSSLMERVEDARKYYSYAEEDIPDYGGEQLDDCARLKVRIDEVLILADCFQDAALMGDSVAVNFKEMASVDENARHLIEAFYACQEGRYAGRRLRDLDLFDTIKAPKSGSIAINESS